MTSPIDSSAPAPDRPSGAGVALPSAGFSWKKLLATTWPFALVPLIVWLGIPLCPSRAIFGVPCPGCGLTRATLALLALDVPRMLAMHPLAPVVTPLVGWWIASAALTSAGLESARKWDPGRVIPRRGWMAIGAALIGLFVVRALGHLGGLPDRVDLGSGLVGRVAIAIGALFE